LKTIDDPQYRFCCADVVLLATSQTKSAMKSFFILKIEVRI